MARQYTYVAVASRNLGFFGVVADYQLFRGNDLELKRISHKLGSCLSAPGGWQPSVSVDKGSLAAS